MTIHGYMLYELEIDDLLPIWGNGYGDGLGVVTRDGTLGYLHVEDDPTPQALPPLAEHVRAKAKESDQAATVDLVLGILDRERL